MERTWLKHYDEGVPRDIDYPETNLYQLFQQSVEKNPSGLATLFFGARMTYRSLAEKVDQFASVLAGLGVRKGDRVALILPNLPIYPIAHFAALKIGAVLTPTNPLYVERELERQLVDSGAETVVILDQLYPRLAQVRANTPVKRVVAAGVKEFLPPTVGFLYGFKNKSTLATQEEEGLYLYRDLMSRKFPPAPSVEVAPDDVAILLYTGGTTGISKAATLTHRNLVANVHQTRVWLSDVREAQEIILCVLPFFHSYGMTTGLHLAVLSRCTMLLLPRFELKDVVKQIRKYKATIFCGVPSMYNAINHYSGLKSSDVASIRLCISGGAGLPAEVQESFEKLTGGRLVEGYGLSEASPVVLVNPIYGHRKIGTIGVPIPNTDARVIDPETHEPLAAGQVGELDVSGPQIMSGYWNRPQETDLVLRDGWLHTGDMAVMDEEGFFSIVDRKKDLILSAGMNIYPREVEEVLHQHPDIIEAAVIGIPSPVRGETPKAFIVAKEGSSLGKREVMQFCQDKLSRFKIPKEIEFRKELPKSAVGKVLKRVLKEEGE